MPHSKLQVPCHRQPWLQRGMGPDTRQVRRIWNILLHLETIASRGDDFRGICNFNVHYDVLPLFANARPMCRQFSESDSTAVMPLSRSPMPPMLW